MVAGVLFLYFLAMGLVILLSIPIAIIILFFPPTHPLYKFIDKHLGDDE